MMLVDFIPCECIEPFHFLNLGVFNSIIIGKIGVETSEGTDIGKLGLLTILSCGSEFN